LRAETARHSMSPRLFRQEAIDHQRFRIWGEVALALPKSYALVTGFIALSVFAMALFVTTHSCARKEHAARFLVPTEGIARVSPPRDGTIIAVYVSEGQHVERGPGQPHPCPHPARGTTARSPMSETKRDYQVGRGKPPGHSRFKTGPARTASEKLARAAGRRAQREGGRDHRRRAARSPRAARSSLSWSTKRPAPICAAPRCCPFTAADEEVMATFITRLPPSFPPRAARTTPPPACQSEVPPHI